MQTNTPYKVSDLSTVLIVQVTSLLLDSEPNSEDDWYPSYVSIVKAIFI